MIYHSYPKDSLPHALRCSHTIAVMRPLICQECTVEDLSRVYLELKKAYYAGNKLMSDLEFDKFEELCRKRYPMTEVFYVVGYVENFKYR